MVSSIHLAPLEVSLARQARFAHQKRRAFSTRLEPGFVQSHCQSHVAIHQHRLLLSRDRTLAGIHHPFVTSSSDSAAPVQHHPHMDIAHQAQSRQMPSQSPAATRVVIRPSGSPAEPPLFRARNIRRQSGGLGGTCCAHLGRSCCIRIRHMQVTVAHAQHGPAAHASRPKTFARVLS